MHVARFQLQRIRGGMPGGDDVVAQGGERVLRKVRLKVAQVDVADVVEPLTIWACHAVLGFQR